MDSNTSALVAAPDSSVRRTGRPGDRFHKRCLPGPEGHLLKSPETLPGSSVWAYALAAYFGLLALIAFWPSPVDAPVQGQLATTLRWMHSHGVPRWINYSFVEMSANVALFIPAGFLGQLALPRLPWWRITAAGMLISGCIEAGQFLFLPHRLASLTDVLTNTAGALLGAVAARKLAPALPRLLGRLGRRAVRRP